MPTQWRFPALRMMKRERKGLDDFQGPIIRHLCFRRHRRKTFAFCLSVRGFVSRPVRETLALNAFERERSTFPILDLAGVPFEIPFDQIAVQMGFADRMVQAQPDMKGQSKIHVGELRLRIKVRQICNHPPAVNIGVNVPNHVLMTQHVLVITLSGETRP